LLKQVKSRGYSQEIEIKGVHERVAMLLGFVSFGGPKEKRKGQTKILNKLSQSQKTKN